MAGTQTSKASKKIKPKRQTSKATTRERKPTARKKKAPKKVTKKPAVLEKASGDEQLVDPGSLSLRIENEGSTCATPAELARWAREDGRPSPDHVADGGPEAPRKDRKLCDQGGNHAVSASDRNGSNSGLRWSPPPRPLALDFRCQHCHHFEAPDLGEAIGWCQRLGIDVDLLSIVEGEHSCDYLSLKADAYLRDILRLCLLSTACKLTRLSSRLQDPDWTVARTEEVAGSMRQIFMSSQASWESAVLRARLGKQR